MTVAVEHSGFLVDLFCWNAPNSTGVDGSDLINNPEAHSTKCMTKVPSCRANGFGLLAQNDDGTYRLEYVFDAAGDAAALAFMDATQLERNILVTVMGTLSSAGAGNGTTPVLAGATIEGKMAVTVEHSGFLVDLFCWNAPNSIGVDGSDLINNPMQHSTKCMTKVPSCRANGFGLLAQNDDGTYRLEYVFDAAGDAAALAFMDATQLESNIVVTVKGSPSFNGGAAPMLTDAIIEGQMAVTVEHSGFLVDLKCWNAPGSIGVDGSDLINDPKSHSTMCMTKVPSCRANGFGILAQNDDGTYRLEYIFDEAGDATALAFLDATQLENNILVTVKGSLAFDGGAAPVLAGLTVRAASRSEAPGAACYGGAAIFESKVSVSVPASPSKASAVTWAGDNAIGYAVNGVAIYSPFSESCGDAVSDVGSFDDCGGGPVDGGVYHYRTAPKCLDGYAAALAAKEPFFIGVALDGFPIYSKFSANGVELTNADLDECHGYESPEGYRYVANDEFPYVTYCYVGTPLVEFDSHCDGVDHATHDHGRRRLHNGEAHAMDTCTSSSSTEPMCTRTADEPVTADSAAAPAPMLHRLAAAAACLALLRAV
ncbi:YHYH protein-domain-containing protein [Pelagophyceae sp. CCMP2097]|nr:YHYH protein-domain-containing protein [Pelagophyceae sp. CCMP2097]